MIIHLSTKAGIPFRANFYPILPAFHEWAETNETKSAEGFALYSSDIGIALNDGQIELGK